jgi:hypothetical protein
MSNDIEGTSVFDGSVQCVYIAGGTDAGRGRGICRQPRKGECMKKKCWFAVVGVFFALALAGCGKYPHLTKIIKNDYNTQELMDWLSYLKEYGINSIPSGEESTIEIVVQSGDLNLVKAAVQDGANVNLFINRTAVYRAASKGDYDIVEFLLKKKASPYYYDSKADRYSWDLISLGVAQMNTDLLRLVVPYYNSKDLDYSVVDKPRLFELRLGQGWGASYAVYEEDVVAMTHLLKYLSSSKIKLDIKDLDTLASNIIDTNYDETFIASTKKTLEYYLNQDYLRGCLDPAFEWGEDTWQFKSIWQYINEMRD